MYCACHSLFGSSPQPPSSPPTGLFLASLAVHLHSQAQRFVPEPLAFATQLLQSVLPEGSTPQPAPSHQRSLAPGQPRWLAVSASDEGAADLPSTEEGIAPLELAQVLGGSAEDAYWRSAAFKTSAAAAAVRLVLRQAELLGGNAALPEILAPALEALRAIVAAAEGSTQQRQQPEGGQCKKQHGKQQKQAAAAAGPAAIVAAGLVALCRSAIETLEGAAAAAQGARRPLYNVHLLKVAEKKQVRHMEGLFRFGWLAGRLAGWLGPWSFAGVHPNPPVSVAAHAASHLSGSILARPARRSAAHAKIQHGCPATPCPALQYNPRFEDDFVSGKDYDPDRWAGTNWAG